MAEEIIPLEPEKFYHIYNHATGKENFFENDDDYKWFLEKLKKYILPVSGVYAYCLMPNHFHFAVKIKSDDELKMAFTKAVHGKNNRAGSGKEINLSLAVSKWFSNYFNAYAKYYNFWKNRQGTLFKRAFRRKLIEGDENLRQLICYIHQNPVAAGLCSKPVEWKYSSYNAIISLRETLLQRKEIIELFDDKDNFIFCHSKEIEMEME